MDEQLPLDVAIRAKLEGCDIAGDIEVVAAGGRKEILATAGGESDVTTILVARGKACLDQN